MAHFARVQDGVVVDVHVLNNAVITDEHGVEHESWGQAFLADLHGGDPADYVQCSYNARTNGRRGMFPGPGMVYETGQDCFAPTVEDVPQIKARAELAAASLGVERA